MKNLSWIVLCLLAILQTIPNSSAAATTDVSIPLITKQQPAFLTFQELISLYHNPTPGGALGKKLHAFWTTPIINNEPAINGVRPHKPIDARIGTLLRVASWNIEKSLHMEQVIAMLTSEHSFVSLIDTKKIPLDSKDFREIVAQRAKLISADVFILEEMEIGVKRSGYINAAEKLAKALNMNYAFAPQYLEIDPVQLGLENIQYTDGSIDSEATDLYCVDPLRFKGIFGSAVLSRYPIIYTEVIPLKEQGYDWYEEEKKKTTYVEVGRRVGAKLAFHNEMTREIKVGGRHFFRVDIAVPDIPEKRISIINVHLEIKCKPAARDRQIKELLSYIKDIEHPVIMMGDFNAAPGDLSPTSLKRLAWRNLKNPTNWLSAAVSYASPYGLAINTSRSISNITKNLQNPLAVHIPIIAPNHVRKMFKRIEKFRFNDGGAFDFRGEKLRSVNGKDGILANSNQKDFKAFKTTFSVKRPIAEVIGKYRLDWVFVKSYLKEPFDEKGPYRMAPHFGETLEELNTAFITPLSDHHPNVVDLPLSDPPL